MDSGRVLAVRAAATEQANAEWRSSARDVPARAVARAAARSEKSGAYRASEMVRLSTSMDHGWKRARAAVVRLAAAPRPLRQMARASVAQARAQTSSTAMRAGTPSTVVP